MRPLSHLNMKIPRWFLKKQISISIIKSWNWNFSPIKKAISKFQKVLSAIKKAKSRVITPKTMKSLGKILLKFSILNKAIWFVQLIKNFKNHSMISMVWNSKANIFSTSSTKWSRHLKITGKMLIKTYLICKKSWKRMSRTTSTLRRL